MEGRSGPGLVAAWCVVALFVTGAGAALAGPVAAPPPTQATAARDQELVDDLTAWDRTLFGLPEDIVLDAEVRQAAIEIASEHVARAHALWPAWIAEQRAATGDPLLQGRALSSPIYLRAMNELALLTVESGGPAQDAAWLRAALAPAACRTLPPRIFARRIAMIQAAPADARPALLAGERALLARWGTKREEVPPRPSAADMAAADQAIARWRAGQTIDAMPMSPFLAGMLFDRDRKPGRADAWEQCAKSQWWLASRLSDGKADKAAALAVYRYSTMFDVSQYVPEEVRNKEASTHQRDGHAVFPPLAAYLQVQGTTTVQVESDERGRPLVVEVVSRHVEVPGVRDNPPVAFESLFDAASIEYATLQARPPGAAAKRRLALDWHLQGEAK